MKGLGTDFGTCNSATVYQRAARDESGNPIYEAVGSARDALNAKQFPSYVRYDDQGKVREIGLDAEMNAELNRKTTVYDIKRLIGRRYDESEFQSYRKFLAYEVAEGNDGQIIIKVGGKDHTPEDVASDLMWKMLERALNDDRDLVINKWIVSVPAGYDSIQRLKTKMAAVKAITKLKNDPHFHEKIAIPDFGDKELEKIQEIQLISEPTAALHTYRAKRKTPIPPNSHILVFDLGAGTLDITIGKPVLAPDPATGMVFEELTVTSVHGNNDLGGRRMDEEILSMIIKKLKTEGKNVSDQYILSKLKKEVELAKIRLSYREKTLISLDIEDIELQITRKEVEDQLQGMLNTIRTEIKQALQSAGTTKENIGAVILVGGPSKMPCVQKVVNEEAGTVDNVPGWDPMLCVAEGAARFANEGGIPDVAGFDYYFGVEKLGAIVPTQIVSRTDTLPISHTVKVKLFRFLGAKDTRQSNIYIISKNNGNYKAFNKIPITIAPGGNAIDFSISYNWPKILYTKEHFKKSIPFSFGEMEVKYEITREGLVTKPIFYDVLSGVKVPFSDIPQLDYGPIAVVTDTEFLRDKEKLANAYVQNVESGIDDEIKSIMNKERVDRRTAEFIFATKGSSGSGNTFEVTRRAAHAAIRLSEQHGVNSAIISQWKKIANDAKTETVANTQALENVINAVQVALKIRDGNTWNEMINGEMKRG